MSKENKNENEGPEKGQEENQVADQAELPSIVELPWKEVEILFLLRNEMRELEEYFAEISLNFEKTKSACLRRIIETEGALYNKAADLKVAQGIPREAFYELKLPQSAEEKGYLVKREEE